MKTYLITIQINIGSAKDIQSHTYTPSFYISICISNGSISVFNDINDSISASNDSIYISNDTQTEGKTR